MKYKLIIDKSKDEQIVATVHAPSRLTEEIENLIKVANIMKDTGLPPTSIRFGFNKAGKPKYEWLLIFFENVFENAILISQENINIYKTITYSIFDKNKQCLVKFKNTITEIIKSFVLSIFLIIFGTKRAIIS